MDSASIQHVCFVPEPKLCAASQGMLVSDVRTRKSRARFSTSFDFRLLQYHWPEADTATALSERSAFSLLPCRTAGHLQISFQPSVAKFGIFGQLNMCGTVYATGRHLRPELGWTGHEIVVKLCRALSCRYPVNCIVVRPERYGNVANPASHRHDRRAEAEATEAGGKATKARSGGKHSCISPDIATHSSAIGTANRSKAGACERFSNGEACRA